MKLHTPLTGIALLAAGALAFTGCSSSGDSTTSDASSNSNSTEISGELNVFAAASLGNSFDKLGEEFEAEHPDVDVVFNYAGSQALVEQLEAGAPADVFASADERNMDNAIDSELMDGDPEIFVKNYLILVTPPDNPADIENLEDATAEGVNLVICEESVPCGGATVKLADDAGVELNPVSEETAVTDVLGKVTSGEADAGLVYVSDANGAGDAVNAIELDNASVTENLYPIGVTAEAPNAEAARAFIEFVQSKHGQEVLEEAGFVLP